MNLQLDNKKAFVAASSEGLGFVTALALLREGAKVTITGRSEARLQAAVQQLKEQAPQAALLALPMDVKDPEQVQAAVTKAAHHWGGLDILITNAGGPPVNAFENLTAENWQTGFELTLMSVVHLVKAALPWLRQSSTASILTITSTSAKQPLPGLLLSNVFRPAVLGLTKTLSQELAPEGIRVNSILPGWTATKRSQELAASYAEKNQTSLEEEVARITKDVPLGRMADPEEFAKVAAFLVSPAAAYVTGVMVPVDGGRTRGLF